MTNFIEINRMREDVEELKDQIDCMNPSDERARKVDLVEKIRRDIIVLEAQFVRGSKTMKIEERINNLMEQI